MAFVRSGSATSPACQTSTTEPLSGTAARSLAWARLVRARVPLTVIRNLLASHGSAVAALAAGPNAWRAAGCPEDIRASLDRPDARMRADLDTDRAWLDVPGQRLIGIDEPDYPALLARSASPPPALFVCGNADLLWFPQIAIVGSRNPSPGGADNARAFAHSFARAGLTVTSGLASGIDAQAHLGALAAGGDTIAVIGTGPDRYYPPGNRALTERIASEGCLISEFPPGTPARRENFPRRNRIIAGLSLGTLVVEAAERSGALITARQAGEAGREVFAIPGSIHNPMARGCHRLIRQGAALVENADEVIAALAPLATQLADSLRARLAEPGLATAATGNRQHPERLPDDPDYHRLWHALGFDPVPLDTLAERTGLTADALSSMLLIMELEGLVGVEHSRYVRRG